MLSLEGISSGCGTEWALKEKWSCDLNEQMAHMCFWTTHGVLSKVVACAQRNSNLDLMFSPGFAECHLLHQIKPERKLLKMWAVVTVMQM